MGKGRAAETLTTDNSTLSEVTVDVNLVSLNNKPEQPASGKAPIDAFPVAPSVAYTFADAKLITNSKVEVTFSDGSSWLFHSAWLLDACRSQVSHTPIYFLML